MEKMDKVFAGLILLALCAFWVIISPAAISSRISEAAPTEVTPAAQVQAQKPPKTTPRSTNRGRTERQLSAAQLKRLKRRDKDTPETYYHERRNEPPKTIPTTDRRHAQPDNGESNRPVYY